MRIFLLASLLLAPVAARAAPITVEVSGIGGARGRVHVDICPEAGFLTPGCGHAGEAAAVPGTTVVTVADVPPGRYAATAYWDANGNGKADRNLFGLPIELVGFSNDVRVHLAPPRFAEAAFVHGTAPQRIAFSVRKIP